MTRSNDAYAWNGLTNRNDSATINGLNQMTAQGSLTLTHDMRGNVTGVGASAYSYTSDNMLKTGPAGTNLAYDPLGRLQSVTQGSIITRFGYDGSDLVTERDGSNTLTRRYVHGPGSDAPIIWYEGAGLTDRRFLHADERGSIVAVTNGAGGVVGTNRYDDYGVPAATNIGRFQYTGQTWMPELGLYNYKARFYDPKLGRFMQTDPIGYGAGMNLYAYVGGDPVNMVDPSGMKSDKCDPAVDICVTGGTNPPLELPSFDWNRIIDINFNIADLGVDSGGPIIVNGTRQEKQGPPNCPTGSRLNIGSGVSGTLFAFVGASLGGGGNLSIPFSTLPLIGDGSFRGTQFSGSASVTPLVGLGAFAGVGPYYTLSGTRNSSPTTSDSSTPVIQIGVGDGAGVEVSSEFNFPPSVSGAGGRYALGLYVAVGQRMERKFTYDPYGCNAL